MEIMLWAGKNSFGFKYDSAVDYENHKIISIGSRIALKWWESRYELQRWEGTALCNEAATERLFCKTANEAFRLWDPFLLCMAKKLILQKRTG